MEQSHKYTQCLCLILSENLLRGPRPSCIFPQISYFFKTAGLKWDIADSIIDSVNKIYILKQIDHEVHHQHEDIL